MGVHSRLTFEDGLDIDFPEIGADPFEITWQSKSIMMRRNSLMRNFKVTAEGRLFREESESERVPEEERPRYDEEIGGFETEIERSFGARRKISHGWSDTDYHGTFHFYRNIDGEHVRFEAKFTDGQLEKITRIE